MGKLMNKFREQKWVYVLLSILLAVVFWLYVRAAEDPSVSATIRNIPIQINGSSVLASKNLTVANLSQDAVSVDVQAPASVFGALSRNNITAAIDVSRIEAAGEHTLTYNVTLPLNINTEGAVIQEKKPETITVTVERLYSNTLPIEFQHKGSVAKGYQAGTPTIEPETVTISGSVEQVSRVARAVIVLEANNLKERFSGDLPLKLLDAQGEELTDLEATSDVNSAYLNYPIVVVKEIPLTVNFLPGGGATEEDNTNYLIVPSTISVSGAKEDIEGLEEISLGSVDLAKVMGTSNFSFPISLDPSLENVTGVSQANVTVTVSGLDTRSFEVYNISAINAPSGYSAVVATEAKTVYVRGTPEALAAIDSSQLRIVADLSNVTASGSYPVPVRVYLDAGTGVGVIGEYNIVVNVTR